MIVGGIEISNRDRVTTNATKQLFFLFAFSRKYARHSTVLGNCVPEPDEVLAASFCEPHSRGEAPKFGVNMQLGKVYSTRSL